MSYDEHCTYENMASYAKGIKKWRKNWEKHNDNSKFPCEDPNNQNKSSNMKCCGYMGNLITENLEYVLLVMNYGIPGWVDYHSRLVWVFSYYKLLTQIYQNKLVF